MGRGVAKEDLTGGLVGCHLISRQGGPVAQWLRALPADKEFLGSNPTVTALSGLPRHEMTSAVHVALNNHSNSNDI